MEGVADGVVHSGEVVTASVESRSEEADGFLDSLWMTAHAIHGEIDLDHVANAHVIAVGAQYCQSALNIFQVTASKSFYLVSAFSAVSYAV
ncbi:hypothetical protein [Acidisphaera sp. S103]|uniref:hypothetical protein n=1 Tax=Acidisphaera sp. S103 TaxID=1747223 RepID=UPI00131B39AD|nr:hypothetical protein [Acidisphaera sp. S103]